MIKRDPNSKQQAVDLIKKSKNILVVTHVRPDGDAVASVLATKLILEKMGKVVDAVIPDELKDSYGFLPRFNDISKEVKAQRDLIVNISSPNGKIGKIGYNKKEDGSIDLIVSPSEGELKKEHVSFSSGGYSYDLIIALDTPSLDRISEAYEKNKKLFEEIAIINIDHHSTNNYFGAVNLFDETATSVCEILVSLVEALDKNLMNEEVATLLLAGIISDTNRFQNLNTTPKSLTVSAQLIAAGARRSEIIKNLYKTLPVSTLRVWGKVLSNIKEDKESRIVWSTLSLREIEDSNSKESDVGGDVLNELLSTAPGAKVILLLVERKGGLITGGMRTSDENVDLDKLALLLGGGGHKQASGFKIEGLSLAEAEREALNKIKGYLGGTRIQETPKQEPVKEKIIFEDKPENEFEKMYSPSISDIDLEKPKIFDDKTSILQKIVSSKKEARENKEKINFAELEKKVSGSNQTEAWEADEDYE